MKDCCISADEFRLMDTSSNTERKQLLAMPTNMVNEINNESKNDNVNIAGPIPHISLSFTSSPVGEWLWFREKEKTGGGNSDEDSVSSLGSATSYEENGDDDSSISSSSSEEEELVPNRRKGRFNQGQRKQVGTQLRPGAGRTSRQERVRLQQAKKRQPRNLSRNLSSPPELLSPGSRQSDSSAASSPSSSPKANDDKRQRLTTMANLRQESVRSLNLDLLVEYQDRQEVPNNNHHSTPNSRWGDSLSKLHNSSAQESSCRWDCSSATQGSTSRWSEGTGKTFTSSQIDQLSTKPRFPKRQVTRTQSRSVSSPAAPTEVPPASDLPRVPQRQKTVEDGIPVPRRNNSRNIDSTISGPAAPKVRPRLPNRQKSFRGKSNSDFSLDQALAKNFAANSGSHNGATSPPQLCRPSLMGRRQKSEPFLLRKRSNGQSNITDHEIMEENEMDLSKNSNTRPSEPPPLVPPETDEVPLSSLQDSPPQFPLRSTSGNTITSTTQGQHLSQLQRRRLMERRRSQSARELFTSTRIANTVTAEAEEEHPHLSPLPAMIATEH